MDGLIARLRVWLFGNVPAHGGKARRIGTALISQIAHGGLRALNEQQLIELVNYLLTSPPLRKPLRGNTRFLQSVSAQYSKKGSMSDKQRQAIYNILEKAYPHNLAAELRHFADQGD
jgi:hypothetical protein